MAGTGDIGAAAGVCTITTYFRAPHLKNVVPNNVEVAMLANDVSRLCSHTSEKIAQAAMPGAVTRVAEWSTHPKMKLNTEKCKVNFTHATFVRELVRF